jgi:carboxymethylenebutenolidase
MVVVPDIGGLRPLFDAMVERLAADTGWSTAAVEPWPGREHLALEERLEQVGTIDEERLLGDLSAAADRLGCERTGVLGFCMGGMFAMKAAASGRFHRAVSFYGMVKLPEQWRGGEVAEPLDSLRAPGCAEVLLLVGTEDPWVPAEHLGQLEGVDHVQVVTYHGADHGFVHDPERPAHRAHDAADAWRRAIEFLADP